MTLPGFDAWATREKPSHECHTVRLREPFACCEQPYAYRRQYGAYGERWECACRAPIDATHKAMLDSASCACDESINDLHADDEPRQPREES